MFELSEEVEEHEDVSLIEQYRSQLSDYKTLLSEIHTVLLSVENKDDAVAELTLHSELEATMFACSHHVRKLLRTHKDSGDARNPTESAGSGVRLPKIAVPTFDGDILSWRQFWEQFRVSVHDRSTMSNAEKLVYLQHALKDGSAKSIIEGLSQSGEQYAEAVGCLTRFDRPRQIHQTHVKMILDEPPVRDGNGRELRRLHDVAKQHLRALRSLEQEPSPAFITSLIELKLDATTMFEWQRHTQSETEVPHYKQILEFIDHRAQAFEISMSGKLQSKSDYFRNRQVKPSRSITAFAIASHDSPGTRCVLCKNERHTIYSCTKFRSSPHEAKLSVVRSNNLCMNCLGKGHYTAKCKSPHRCRKCQRPHHTLLHIENGGPSASPLTNVTRSLIVQRIRC